MAKKKILTKKRGKDNRKNRKWDWHKFGKYAGYTALALLLIVAITFAWFSKDLPTAGKIKNRHVAQSTTITDRNDKLLYKIHGEKNRTIIDQAEIPDHVKQATVAVEDHDFYSHHGVDFSGVLRAAWVNLTNSGIHQGGSTLTQQLVKNALLSPQRTYTRKIKELILSIEMEFMYSKDEILTMYLNEIPYGSNAYGIEAAAQTYFNKHAKDLNLVEAATLAALPQAPTYYSPYGSNTDELINRRNHVLREMVELGYIDQEKYDRIENNKIDVANRSNNLKAPHFVMYIKQLVAQEYGERMLEEGGLKITTTLDLKLQDLAEKAVKEGAERNASAYGGDNAALVSIDPNSGEILAMVGSKDFFDTENDGNVNVAIRERQPGSALKPIIYATLFKGQWSPGSTLYDLVTDFGGGYEPKNYDRSTRGPVSIRTSLANSLNIPAVKALALTGLDESIKTASDMGITTLTEPERYGLSLVLGGGEVKLLELTGAFGSFANNGLHYSNKSILKIEDSNGEILKDNYETDPKRVLKKEIAYEINDILSDKNARAMTFGYTPYLDVSDRPSAAKTGTTSDFKDGWTVGYTRNLVTGVWVGNNDNRPMASGAAGAAVAAPIWDQFMEQATDGFKQKNFNRPDTIKNISLATLSNQKATNKSWRVTNDIAAIWQIPDKYDSTFQEVKIDKSTNKLATKYCPSNLVIKKMFGSIHSAMPDNPNWEGPVQAWARSQGIKLENPPEEECDIHTKENLPTISITDPIEGSEFSDPFTVNVNANAPLGIDKVQFYIDNKLLNNDTNRPYQTEIDPADYENGEHTIRVILIGNYNLTSQSQVTISFTGEVEGEETDPPPEEDDSFL
jgi:1A family penicillin-binding protein